MRAVASFSRDLRALDIRGCWRVTDKGVSLAGEYCTHLRVLNVVDCRDVTERSLGKLRTRGVRIDRLLNPLLAGRGPAVAGNPPLRLQV